ncbi:hypothetical protein B4119_2210 [Parageobacillus caldoxylosilyticus]|uniref:Uncharacterized protein n=1 Tax=Saccharococcus caldoxylosilyticus TaxID=81408 RepID=A0A150LV27_9BACL|nr:hypothetical protein B4119_2210 [Parageobacillus caldoxylosilyticus]
MHVPWSCSVPMGILIPMKQEPPRRFLFFYNETQIDNRFDF